MPSFNCLDVAFQSSARCRTLSSPSRHVLQVTDYSQKLPCTFEIEGPGLGFLEGNVGEDVRENPPRSVSISHVVADQAWHPSRPSIMACGIFSGSVRTASLRITKVLNV